MTACNPPMWSFLKAIDRFDATKARLSTYAVWSIRAELNELVRRDFAAVSIPKGERILQSYSLEIKKQMARMAKSRSGKTVSLEAAVQEDVLVEAADIGHMRDRAKAIAREVLDERERAIFEARNLVDVPPTLEKLGRDFGISRERVRQLEARALKKVKEAASRPGGSRSPFQDQLAAFYAATLPRHHGLEGYLDAVRKRFPKATEADHLSAHRAAEMPVPERNGFRELARRKGISSAPS